MNFSHFFIRRPIFAGVLSIVIFLVGLDRHVAAAHQRISGSRAADGRRAGDLSRRESQDHRRDRRLAAGTSHQRRRGFALHVLAVHGRRRHDADGDVQARHRHRQGAGAGAEPRLASSAETAGGSSPARRHHHQAIARPHDGRAPVLAERSLRRSLSAQLRDAAGQGRAGAHPGRGSMCRCSARATTRCASG